MKEPESRMKREQRWDKQGEFEEKEGRRERGKEGGRDGRKEGGRE